MNVNSDYVIINKNILLIGVQLMNTMQISCFLAVAETLNFARAAERLHVTQPAVTQQIHSLEAELNMQLFQRTTRTVELTQAGLLFLDDAKAMFELYERAKKRAEYSADDTREPFTIGFHSCNEVSALAELLRKMKAQFPNLYPIFRIVPFQHLYQRLSEEAVDVVISFRESGFRKGIQYRELTRIRIVGVMEAGHPLCQAGRLYLRDLKREPVIALDPQRCPADYRKILHQILENKPPLDIYFCDSAETAVTLAEAGYGIALVPELLPNQNQGICRLPIMDAEPMSYGVYYKTLSEHPRRKAFVRLAKEACLDMAQPKHALNPYENLGDRHRETGE